MRRASHTKDSSGLLVPIADYISDILYLTIAESINRGFIKLSFLFTCTTSQTFGHVFSLEGFSLIFSGGIKTMKKNIWNYVASKKL